MLTVFSFLRRRRKEKEDETDICPSLVTSTELPDDDMAWFFPPRDVHDHTVWDHYWQEQAAHGLTPPLFEQPMA
jgi:hypothetical protein